MLTGCPTIHRVRSFPSSQGILDAFRFGQVSGRAGPDAPRGKGAAVDAQLRQFRVERHVARGMAFARPGVRCDLRLRAVADNGGLAGSVTATTEAGAAGVLGARSLAGDAGGDWSVRSQGILEGGRAFGVVSFTTVAILCLAQSRSFIPQIRRYCGSDKAGRVFSELVAMRPSTFRQSTRRPKSPSATPHFNILFAGNIGEAQDFPAIIEAADLARDGGIRWLIVG